MQALPLREKVSSQKVNAEIDDRHRGGQGNAIVRPVGLTGKRGQAQDDTHIQDGTYTYTKKEGRGKLTV